MNGYACIRYTLLIDAYARLGEGTSRAPDIAIALPTEDDSALAAANILLAVEIAAASSRYDFTLKAADDARAGIVRYWVADVIAREMHVLGAPVDGAYAGTAVTPVADPLALRDSDRTTTLAD